MEDPFNTAFDASDYDVDRSCGFEESREIPERERFKAGIAEKLFGEMERLGKFHESSLLQLNIHSKELNKQISEFATGLKDRLSKQVREAEHELEAALELVSSSPVANSRLTEQLLKVNSDETLRNVELLTLSFSVTPINLASLVSSSASFSVKLSNDLDLKTADMSLVKTREKPRTRTEGRRLCIVEALDGEFEQFDVSKIKLELSNIDKPKQSRIMTPTASSSIKRGLKDKSGNSSPIRSSKKLSVTGASKINPSKTLMKQTSLIEMKLTNVQPARSLKTPDLQKATPQTSSRISKPTLTRKLSSELNDSCMSTSFIAKPESKMPTPTLKEPNTAQQSKAMTLNSKAETLRKRNSTAVSSPRVDLSKQTLTIEASEISEAITERPTKSRLTTVLSKKEEIKTTKPRPVNRQSLQLKQTDQSFRTTSGLRSPTKDMRGLCTPRAQTSLNAYQLMHYFIPLSGKVLTLQVETESVFTVELDIPEAFYEGAAWCETPSQELLYTGGLADAPLKKSWLISPHRKSFMEVTPMLTARHSHQLCAISDLIFAIGGAGPEPLNEVEYFSMRNCSWKKAGSLNFPRAKPAACVHNGSIYVAGGYDQDSIEQYDLVEEQFSLLYIVLPSPGMCSMTTYNDNLIILQNDKVIELEATTPSIKELCNWKLAPCWSPASILFRDGLVYMTVRGEFTRFNIRTQTVEKL